MPPAKAFASVTVLLAATLLWLTVVLLIVADAWGVTKMPPPCASPQTALLESSTVLPLTALAAIVSSVGARYRHGNVIVQLFSATTRQGVEEAEATIASWVST